MRLEVYGKALALAASLLLSAAFAPAAVSTFDWKLPAGVAPPPVPADNPMSDAKVELGRKLFYDADLSIDGTMSCATCHEQRRGFTDSNRTRPGVHGDPGRRNIQTLANVGYFRALTWGDASVKTLESQALIPIAGTKPVEMGFAGQEAVLTARLAGQACYRRMFGEAFPEAGGKVSMTTIAKALAAFQRTFVSFDSPYDRRRRGEDVAVSAEAERGERLFKARCASCHAGPLFTDADKPRFHRIDAPFTGDQGLADVTGEAADAGRFRTPSLRNAALSAPYLHDGSAPTLETAIRRHRVAMRLEDRQVADLVAFLGTLTDETFVKDSRFSLPKPGCGS
ncbi:cytochrome-c peroxidase [Caulobacter endophyticus]|uniref:cytochrome-c peroxidase n=1 Tax=Caulobacter endophyticus TaxID=2172652 RepID=UPI00240EF518|nr:cytochrome c peroxidase [Caulobacter endophyticus]MDG2529136.1 cytochrome c peroxidase [Caulobacter endophyticus]